MDTQNLCWKLMICVNSSTLGNPDVFVVSSPDAKERYKYHSLSIPLFLHSTFYYYQFNMIRYIILDWIFKKSQQHAPNYSVQAQSTNSVNESHLTKSLRWIKQTRKGKCGARLISRQDSVCDYHQDIQHSIYIKKKKKKQNATDFVGLFLLKWWTIFK